MDPVFIRTRVFLPKVRSQHFLTPCTYFFFLPFSGTPFFEARCVGCRTSLRALIRGLANQFKYQRRARRNFISFPISCACVGGFNSAPAPLIPTTTPLHLDAGPLRTSTREDTTGGRFSIRVFFADIVAVVVAAHPRPPVIVGRSFARGRRV